MLRTNLQTSTVEELWSEYMQLTEAEAAPTEGREIRLRRIAEATSEQKALLRHLGLGFPERFELNRKCSVDSAIS